MQLRKVGYVNKHCNFESPFPEIPNQNLITLSLLRTPGDSKIQMQKYEKKICDAFWLFLNMPYLCVTYRYVVTSTSYSSGFCKVFTRIILIAYVEVGWILYVLESG